MWCLISLRRWIKILELYATKNPSKVIRHKLWIHACQLRDVLACRHSSLCVDWMLCLASWWHCHSGSPHPRWTLFSCQLLVVYSRWWWFYDSIRWNHTSALCWEEGHIQLCCYSARPGQVHRGLLHDITGGPECVYSTTIVLYLPFMQMCLETQQRHVKLDDNTGTGRSTDTEY